VDVTAGESPECHGLREHCCWWDLTRYLDEEEEMEMDEIKRGGEGEDVGVLTGPTEALWALARRREKHACIQDFCASPTTYKHAVDAA